MGGRQKRYRLVLAGEGDNQQERFASYLIAAVQQAPTVTVRYVRRWRKNGNMPAYVTLRPAFH